MDLGVAGFELHPELIDVHTEDCGLPCYQRCDDETSWITDGAPAGFGGSGGFPCRRGVEPQVRSLLPGLLRCGR